jgi:hypothetical protein
MALVPKPCLDAAASMTQRSEALLVLRCTRLQLDGSDRFSTQRIML